MPISNQVDQHVRRTTGTAYQGQTQVIQHHRDIKGLVLRTIGWEPLYNYKSIEHGPGALDKTRVVYFRGILFSCNTRDSMADVIT